MNADSRRQSPPGRGSERNDRRYESRRWKATRLRVLHRDLWRCFVPGCAASATVADHIVPVHAGMSDTEFYDEANLRAACRPHNVRRGVAARLERELGGTQQPVRRHRLAAPLRRPAPPIVEPSRRPEDARPQLHRFAYHEHRYRATDAMGTFIGYMHPGEPLLPTCPPDCTLPRHD